MKSVSLLLSDEVFHRVQRLATQHGADVSVYLAALIADSTVPPPPRPAPVAPPPTVQNGGGGPLSSLPSSPRDAPMSGSATAVPKMPQSDISLIAKWDLLGRGRPEGIREDTAATTVARLLDRMAAIFGEDILAQLSAFRIARGPLVSRSPAQDFVDLTTGEIYAHQRIGSRPYFVLTHGSTDEKIQGFREMLQFLKFPEGMLDVTRHQPA